MSQPYRRLAIVRLAGLAGGLLAAAALAWTLGTRRATYPDVEIEPDDQPAQATPIGVGHRVRGFVGKRDGRGESDRDYYRVAVPRGGPQQLRVDVSGIPNMDVELEVFDSTDRRLAQADSSGLPPVPT